MMLDIQDDLLKAYLFYGALLALKMLVMAPLTGRQRLKKKVFANQEDLVIKKDFKLTFSDPDVERVRRAHLNDMENIYLYFFVSALYILTNPSVSVAKIVFQVFTASRYVHTFVYLNEIQPARSIVFAVGLCSIIFMLYKILCFAC